MFDFEFAVKYVGSIDEKACPDIDEKKLLEKARKEVREMADSDQNVKIEGPFENIATEERCSENRKN